MNLGLTEAILLLALFFSIIWVFYDAPKYGINRFVAILAVILLIYPIGFLLYISFTRLKKSLNN